MRTHANSHSILVGPSRPTYRTLPYHLGLYHGDREQTPVCLQGPHHLFDLQVDSDEENLPVETKVIEGSFTSDFYDCVAEKAGMRYFYQQWQDRRFAEGRNYMTSGRYDDAVDLPVELGEGWIDVPLGIGWMSWRCDDRAVISRFSAPGDRDRDEQEDTQRLLEIAQQRYAELNDCEIRPPE